MNERGELWHRGTCWPMTGGGKPTVQEKTQTVMPEKGKSQVSDDCKVWFEVNEAKIKNAIGHLIFGAEGEEA